MSKKELTPTSKHFISSENLEDRIIIKKNKWIFLITAITLGIVSIWLFIHVINPFILGYCLATFMGLGSVLLFYNFFDRNGQIIMNNKGISFPNEGLLTWDEIRNSFIEHHDYSDGDSVRYTYKLILELHKKEAIKFNITYLDRDPKWIANKFENFKNKYISEK